MKPTRNSHGLVVLRNGVLFSLAVLCAVSRVHADEVVVATAPDAPGATYNVTQGDTLWDITGRNYGDPYQWPKLWSYNPEITNPHWIYPGSTVRLYPGNANASAVDMPLRQGSPASGSSDAIWLRAEGFLDTDALAKRGVLVGSRLDKMMLAPMDQAYVRFDRDAPRTIGDVYSVYRKVNQQERAPGSAGELVRIVGFVRLDDYNDASAVGRVTIMESLDALERGMPIAPLARKFERIDPTPSTVSADTRIIALLDPVALAAGERIVFINAGASTGILRGNTVFVVRRGDAWRDTLTPALGKVVQADYKLPQEPRDYPWEVVATGMVVDVQSSTSAVLLRNTERGIIAGDVVRLVAGR